MSEKSEKTSLLDDRGKRGVNEDDRGKRGVTFSVKLEDKGEKIGGN